MASRASKYFTEVFHCESCNNLIILKANQRFDFSPLHKNKNSKIFISYLGEKWPGILSANFNNGKGEIYWNTNYENGFRQNLTLEELKELYNKKFKELKDLKILRHSFLNINGNVEHQYEDK